MRKNTSAPSCQPAAFPATANPANRHIPPGFLRRHTPFLRYKMLSCCASVLFRSALHAASAFRRLLFFLFSRPPTPGLYFPPGRFPFLQACLHPVLASPRALSCSYRHPVPVSPLPHGRFLSGIPQRPLVVTFPAVSPSLRAIGTRFLPSTAVFIPGGLPAPGFLFLPRPFPLLQPNRPRFPTLPRPFPVPCRPSKTAPTSPAPLFPIPEDIRHGLPAT